MDKKSKVFCLIILTLIILGCKDTSPNFEYMNQDGIMIEILEQPQNNIERDYTKDNRIYKKGKSFDFNYRFENANGEKYLYHQMTPKPGLSSTEREALYFLVPFKESIHDFTQKITLEILGGPSPFGDDYTQTLIRFKYFKRSGIQQQEEKTGLIENLENIWMHPPRIGMFRILELNPFPYVKFPLKIGKKWDWELNIGDGWGNSKWKEWEGSILNKYEYKITDNVQIESGMGNLDCYVINAEAESRIGKTYLKSYFNEIHGFVRLEYINIDSSKTIFELDI